MFPALPHFLGNLLPSHSFILHPKISQKWLCLYPLSPSQTKLPSFHPIFPALCPQPSSVYPRILPHRATAQMFLKLFIPHFSCVSFFSEGLYSSLPLFIFHKSTILLILLKCHPPGETQVLFQNFLLQLLCSQHTLSVSIRAELLNHQIASHLRLDLSLNHLCNSNA